MQEEREEVSRLSAANTRFLVNYFAVINCLIFSHADWVVILVSKSVCHKIMEVGR